MNTPDEAEDASLSMETEQRQALITSRFPGRFSEEQNEEIRSRIQRSIRLGQSLRTTTLANGEGPDLNVTVLPPTPGAE
jgi:hypothetical protein